MSICSKCSGELDNALGYSKCLGCNSRYHFGQCSVTATTWKSKTAALRAEWRCEVCRKSNSSSQSKDTNLSPIVPKSGPSDVQNAITSSFKSFSTLQEERFVSLEKKLKSHSSSLFEGLETLINGLISQLEVIKDDMKTMEIIQQDLYKQNQSLENELRQSREKICTLELKMRGGDSRTLVNQVPPVPTDKKSRSQMPYSTAVTKEVPGATLASKSSSSIVGAAVVGSSSVSHSQIQSGKQVNSARSTSLSAETNSSAQSGSEDGWTKVNHRQRKERNTGGPRTVPKIGKMTQTSGSQSLVMVKPVPPRVRTSALFVSRFAPNVSSKDIESMIVQGSNMQFTHLKVVKIKTRYIDSYSSFRVEVHSLDFDKIYDVDIWPVGCLIKPYLGKLLPEVVVKEDVTPAASNETASTTALQQVNNVNES